MLTLWIDVQARHQALLAEAARDRMAAGGPTLARLTLRVVLARALRELANRLDCQRANFESSDLRFADRRRSCAGLH